MKKFIIGAVLAMTMSSANAGSFYNNVDGLWYGNVCRTGAYYSIVAYQPIGFGCYNYGWNMWGVISGN
jgi:hypothetical protein